MTKTAFVPIDGSPEGVARMLELSSHPLIVVSRHGLGDNIFFSPCFKQLKAIFPKVYFCSCVNAYTSIFHLSDLVVPLYLGGVNGHSLRLSTAQEFATQFAHMDLDIGAPCALVYHFGLFEPSLPYSDERAFVKGRRNTIELFGDGPSAIDVPQYHVAPDLLAQSYVDGVLDRWLDGRDLIVIARYGHTDSAKNFGDDHRDTVELVNILQSFFPNRFRFLSLDYSPGGHTAEGWCADLRSVYGFLPCDSASLYYALARASAQITVPTGAMLVGATLPNLKMLTLWKSMIPFHFLDPQNGDRNPVHALVENASLADEQFMNTWSDPSRTSLKSRWRVRIGHIDPISVATYVATMLEPS